ncbi:hypothetical protein RJ639_046758 [Escallonia herrerae]|uniref:Uncharacterized protein n=1 Tax=Escallonia herrerae TaxID=1293975 RepID=A0AA88WIB4_9ASTE|nr:hypothetical protein RJ639_046758 [Escallonia herrerae]
MGKLGRTVDVFQQMQAERLKRTEITRVSLLSTAIPCIQFIRPGSLLEHVRFKRILRVIEQHIMLNGSSDLRIKTNIIEQDEKFT